MAMLAATLGACSSSGTTAAVTSPSMAAPLETRPDGGVAGEILDTKKVGSATLRYTVRLDDGKAITVDEPASRYLANGSKVWVVAQNGRTVLVKR
jgi:outer membrane lipoprotein SlyB